MTAKAEIERLEREIEELTVCYNALTGFYKDLVTALGKLGYTPSELFRKAGMPDNYKATSICDHYYTPETGWVTIDYRKEKP